MLVETIKALDYVRSVCATTKHTDIIDQWQTRMRPRLYLSHFCQKQQKSLFCSERRKNVSELNQLLSEIQHTISDIIQWIAIEYFGVIAVFSELFVSIASKLTLLERALISPVLLP